MDNRRLPKGTRSRGGKTVGQNDRAPVGGNRTSDSSPRSGTSYREGRSFVSGSGRDGRFARPLDGSAKQRPKPLKDVRTTAPHRKSGEKPEPLIRITSDVQITDGRFYGRSLVNSLSPNSAPTSRMLRDAIFVVASRAVRGGRVLDLCAGCGAVGFEAISRGAMLVTFVERSAKMASFLRKNVEELGINDGHVEIFEIEAVPFIKRYAARKRKWDLIFVGKVGRKDADEIAAIVSRGSVIEPGGTAVFEHPADYQPPGALGRLTLQRTISKDGAVASIYTRKQV